MIPSELIQVDKWITWKYKDGDKKPLNPSGRVDNALNSQNWQSYQDAAQKSDQLGFVLTGDYVVIDGDHEPYISILTERFINKTYCEISPNGGIHVWLRGTHRNKKGNFEIYSSRRWMTVTGYGNGIIKDITGDDVLWFSAQVK